MRIEEISNKNIKEVTKLVLNLWTDSNFEEEFKVYKRVILSDKETCFLVLNQNEYIGLIHLSLRFEFVEGANSSPVAYLEGIYIKPEFRKKGIGKKLINIGEKWGKNNGCKQYASDTRIGDKQSIGFHQKSGFKEVNRIVEFIKNIE